MSSELRDLVDRRHRILRQARQLMDDRKRAGRDLSSDDVQRTDRMFQDIDKLGERIRVVADGPKDMSEYRGRLLDLEADGPFRDTSTTRRHFAYQKWVQGGPRALSFDESRELNTTNTGGYMIVPVQSTVDILMRLDELLFIRAKGTVLDPVAPPPTITQLPVIDTNPDDADWTTELGAAGYDSGMTTGARLLKPHQLTKGIKVSNALLAASAGRAEAVVNNRLARAVALPQEKTYLTGDGVQKPLGLFTASNQGISTGRDITTGSTTTSLTGDSFVHARFNVKSQYQVHGEWVLHRDALKQAMLLKDGEGRYVWAAATTPGGPDMILGKPVNQSEYAPNTFTTGQYVGLFGDLSYYHIVDQLVEIQRLSELFAATNQTAFIIRDWTDGMPTIEEAFTRLKLA